MQRPKPSGLVALLGTVLYSQRENLQEGCSMHLYVTQVTSIMGFCVECMCIHTSHVDACVYGGQAGGAVFLSFFRPHPLRLSY